VLPSNTRRVSWAERHEAWLLLDAKFVPGHSVHDDGLPLRTERNQGFRSLGWHMNSIDHPRN
jgi:hypothetical protein